VFRVTPLSAMMARDSVSVAFATQLRAVMGRQRA